MLPYTSHIAKKLKGTATLLFLLFCVCSAVARDTTRVFSKLPWYEDDRLNLVAGDGYLSYYAYGHDGNRAIKMTGNATIDPNGTLTNTGDLNNITIYPNEYLSVTQAEYTKYYYAGGNRIASKIGTGGFEKMQQLCTLDQSLTANANTLFDNVLQQAVNTTNPPTDEYPVDVCAGYSVATELLTNPLPDFYISQTNLNFTQNNLLQQFRQNLAGGAEAVYFFHSDHLGSASWITNNTGLPVQHLLYLPFGEHFANEHSSGYDERFTFTGKERDAETGYYYHGARFNCSDIGWLSVDPMADKYPSLTPYNYCAWNPIKFIDPDGRKIWITGNDGNLYQYKKGKIYNSDGQKYSGNDEFVKKVYSDLKWLSKNGIRKELRKMVKSKYDITISQTDEGSKQCSLHEENQSNGTGCGSYILFNPNITELERDGKTLPAYGLAHELGHAYDAMQGIIDDGLVPVFENGASTTNKYLPMSEIRAVKFENYVRPINLQRTSYCGFDLRSSGVIKEIQDVPENNNPHDVLRLIDIKLQKFD